MLRVRQHGGVTERFSVLQALVGHFRVRTVAKRVTHQEKSGLSKTSGFRTCHGVKFYGTVHIPVLDCTLWSIVGDTAMRMTICGSYRARFDWERTYNTGSLYVELHIPGDFGKVQFQ
jgi:hypothetical protein